MISNKLTGDDVKWKVSFLKSSPKDSYEKFGQVFWLGMKTLESDCMSVQERHQVSTILKAHLNFSDFWHL